MVSYEFTYPVGSVSQNLLIGKFTGTTGTDGYKLVQIVKTGTADPAQPPINDCYAA